jgi:hypothetical protein
VAAEVVLSVGYAAPAEAGAATALDTLIDQSSTAPRGGGMMKAPRRGLSV